MADPRNLPDTLWLRFAVEEAHTLAVEYRLGEDLIRESCNQEGKDHVGLVTKPSLVIARPGTGRTVLSTVPLEHTFRIEAKDCRGNATVYARSPEGLWLRFYTKL